jgi:hypothetical protein
MTYSGAFMLGLTRPSAARCGLTPLQLRVCLLYLRHRRQIAVAAKLDMSQPSVSRVLARAKQRLPRLELVLRRGRLRRCCLSCLC